MKNRSTTRRSLGIIMLAILALTLMTHSIASAQNPNSFVVPPHSHEFGKSYGKLSAEWWQWALSIPKSANPLLDQTGENCIVG